MANGLIDLQTDLKSLRYGNDKPYITKNIGDAPGSRIGMEVQARIDDTSRIAQMLIDKPGLRFIGNQALLQQVDIQGKLQKARDKKTTLGGKIFEQVKGTVLNTAKIVGSTLAQVPVNGTGTHFVYGFRTDTYLSPATTNSFTQFFGAGGVEGAPLALRGEVIPVSKLGTTPEGTQLAETTARPEQLGQLHIGIKGDITPLEQPVIKPFREEDQKKKAKNSTKDNISNALTGSAIPLSGTQSETTLASKSIGISNQTTGSITSGEIAIKPFEQSGYEGKKRSKLSTENNIANALTGSAINLSGAVETTVTPGVKTKQNLITGSLSNKDVKYDLGDNGVDTGEVYTSTSTYTGKDAAYNIGATLSGSYTIPTGGPVPTDLVVGMSIQDSKNKPQYEKSHTDPTTNRVYTEGNKYYEEQKNRKIGDSQKNVIREKRVGLGDQSKRNKSGVAYYTNPTDDEIDQINYLDVTTVRPEGAGVGRDLAKLYFEIITPDAQPRFLYFRAFIDNFDDGYTADWQAHKYVGRAENFYTYGGFDRDITLSFKVAAATRVEMKPLYKKMVYLASATAPTYGGMMTKYMRGTFAKMTVGSYLDQVPGVITSVKYNLIEEMPWEIAMGQPEGVEPEAQVLPMGMQCAVTFKPIHTFAPQTGLYPYFTNANEEPRYFTEQDAVLI